MALVLWYMDSRSRRAREIPIPKSQSGKHAQDVMLWWVTAESGSGKSPFYENVMQPCLTATSDGPSLISSHADIFEHGGAKGFLFARGSDADFCQRMHDSQGRLFLASDESISILDTDYLSGQSKGKDSSKVDLQTLLSTQNGGPYGPRSLKSA